MDQFEQRSLQTLATPQTTNKQCLVDRAVQTKGVLFIEQ